MADHERRHLVVIVPAYDEADRISETIEALRKSTAELVSSGIDTSIFVIDDGSRDETTSLASAAGADRVIRHRINQGLGAAVRTGLTAARNAGADLVVKFDADLQHDPSDIPALIDPILTDEADVVYGNRFDRIEYRMPLVRRVGNRVFTALMQWLTRWPLRDSQPGILAVGRAYLERFHLPGNYNYTQQVLLDAYHRGLRFAHVPVAFRERETGQSFVSLKYPFKVLPQIFWLLVGVRPMKIFGSVGLLFLAVASGVLLWDISRWMAGVYAKPAQHVNAIIGFGLFGLQTLFFGVLAHLIIMQRSER